MQSSILSLLMTSKFKIFFEDWDHHTPVFSICLKKQAVTKIIPKLYPGVINKVRPVKIGIHMWPVSTIEFH